MNKRRPAGPGSVFGIGGPLRAPETGEERVRHSWVAGVCAALAGLAAGATDPGTAVQAAVAAKGCLPGLLRAGKGVVDVPYQAGQCLRLPLGLVEMAFSPLPGVAFSDGLKDAGKGVVAPFKLCLATLEMPVKVFGGLGDSVAGLAR